MMRHLGSWWVPVGSFGLAIVLSLAGQPRMGIAKRAPADTTSFDCTLTIDSLTGKVQAIHWLAEPMPGHDGFLALSGSYTGDTNVLKVKSTETMSLKLHIFLEEVDLGDPPVRKCDGLAYGKLHEAKQETFGSDSQFLPKPWFENFSHEPNDQGDLKAAISDAKDKVVLMCLKEHPNLGPVEMVQLFRTIHHAQKRAEVEFTVKAEGTTSGGVSCNATDTKHADVKLKESGFGNGPLQ